MPEKTVSSAGLTCSVAASLMFGLIPWYVQWLTPLSGLSLFWSRIVFSTLTAALALIVLKQGDALLSLFRNRKTMLLLALGTSLVACQWWLFVWAPVNGMTKELSQGYFLLPLTLTLTGRLVYGEQLRFLQKLALLAACIAVTHEIYASGCLSWVPLMVAGGYPFYFIVRRAVTANALACFLFENLLLFPLALFALLIDTEFHQILTNNQHLALLLPGLGILCTSSMLVYVIASKLLPVSLFGLLGYLEPAIIFTIAVTILGEFIPTEQWLTYGFIWVATIIICFDSVMLIRKSVTS